MAGDTAALPSPSVEITPGGDHERDATSLIPHCASHDHAAPHVQSEGGVKLDARTSSGWLYPGTVPRSLATASENSSCTPHVPCMPGSTDTVHPGTVLDGIRRVHCAPALQHGSSTSRDPFNMFTSPQYHRSYPGFSDGSCNYVAKWGPGGHPFWEFQLRSAAARVRHAAGDAAKPDAKPLRDQDRELLHRVVAPSVISRCRDTASVFDVLDRRVEKLIPAVIDLPYGDKVHVVEEICENLAHSVRVCGHLAEDVPSDPIPAGIPQVENVMDMLNRVDVDCEDGLYTRCAS